MLAYMRRSSPHWQTEDAPSWRTDWIFRGHADADWPLKPSALRDLLPIQLQSYIDFALPHAEKQWDAREPFTNYEIDWFTKEHSIYASAHTYAECRLIREFCRQAESIGFSIPGAEKIKKSKLKFTGLPFPSTYHGMTITQAIAQHHGIPTRLMDWSWNPTTAAFFACSNIEDPDPDKNLCVWGMRHSQFHKLLIKVAESKAKQHFMSVRVFEVPRKDFHYLHVQEGLFLGLPSVSNFYAANGRWPDLVTDVFGCKPELDKSVVKITLPQTEALELYRLLTLDGVSLCKLMPTYDSVARDVAMKWKLARRAGTM